MLREADPAAREVLHKSIRCAGPIIANAGSEKLLSKGSTLDFTDGRLCALFSGLTV